MVQKHLNLNFPFIFSGRKRRGSETLSDSSGDEYYGTNGIISTSTQLSYWNPQSSLRQQSNGTPISDSSLQNDQLNNEAGNGCRSGPVMSECTAALVLMNLSHSPANYAHHTTTNFGEVTYTVGGGGSDSGTSTVSASIIPVSTQSYHTNLVSSHNEDSQSKRMAQHQRRGHAGHVRCLPGGACLVGSDFSASPSLRLPEQQVQGI